MTRIISLLLCFILVFCNVTYAKSNVIGEVLTTDIAAFIDAMPIESYNIKGNTYVVGEDLQGYGFDVTWNEQERWLDIVRNPEGEHTFLPAEKINILKSDIKVGRKSFNVYATDIKTFIGQNQVSAYNINGKTMICMDDLATFGYLEWNEELRQIALNMTQFDLDTAFANLPEEKKNELTLKEKDERISKESETYIGETQNSIPNGLGIKEIKHQVTESPSTFKTRNKYFGYFNNGVMDGKMIVVESLRDTYNHAPYNVSINYYNGNYKNGQLIGFCIESNYALLSFTGKGYWTRFEGYYVDGKANGFGRYSKNDPRYLYDFFVYKEGIYKDGEAIESNMTTYNKQIEEFDSYNPGTGNDPPYRGNIPIWMPQFYVDDDKYFNWN